MGNVYSCVSAVTVEGTLITASEISANLPPFAPTIETTFPPFTLAVIAAFTTFSELPEVERHKSTSFFLIRP